ncbi:MAG: Calx-beta domain-containing protein, partial [Planctomycetaceae bacterium]
MGIESLESRRLLSFTLVGGVRTGSQGLVDVSSDLTLTFSEPVQLGSTGAIRLYGESGWLVESFGATASPLLQASGSTLTIDPTWDLNGGSLYYLTLDAGSVASLDGTPFAGVSDTSTLQFGTDVETGAAFGPSSMEDQFPGTASESIGDHRALYMRVTYPDVHRSPNSLSEAEADMTTSSLAWIRNSRGVASLSTTYTPLITLPFTHEWLNQFDSAPGQDGLSMIQNAAQAEAARMGFNPADYNVRIVRVDTSLRSGASWGGGDSVWVSWGGYHVLVHEAGHAVGQGHASSITWSGTKSEYGSELDWMGSGYDLFDVFGVNSQVNLKWVDDADLLQNPGAGIYRLFGVDSGRQVVGQTYGLRQVVPQDELMGILNETTSPAYTLEFRPLQPGQLQQSAVLLRNNRVIDLTSQTSGDFQDGGIRAGQTLQIPGSQSYFTVLDQQGDHLDVAYQQGPFPDNVAPSVVLTASATTVRRFGEVTFSADVLDVNGDQVVYDWTFGDGVTGSGKTFTRMFRQSTAQDVSVTLTVSDMRGGVTTVTTAVSAGAASTGTPVTLGSHSPPTDSLPRVALVASDGFGGEGGDAASLTVSRLGTALDEPLVVQLEYGGTANTAADFASLPTTVTIPAGESFVTLPLTPVDDAIIEPNEKLSVTLVASTAYTISSQNGSASLTVSDDDTPVVTIEAVDAAASEPTAEGRDTGLVLIRRTGPTTSPLTVYYGVTGTAANGADFGRLNGQVVIPAGQTSATVMVNPIDDGRGEQHETVDLTLASFNDAYSVGLQGSATVTIHDNADRPVVSLRASGSRATEGEAGKVTFNVVGGDGRELTVQYTVTGTATNGTDYQTLSGNLVIPAGGTNRTVDVAIQSLFDTVAENDESAILTLSPNSTYQAGLETTAEVALADVIDTATGGDRVWVSRDFPGKQTAGLEDAAENGQVPLRYFVYRDNTTASRQALNVTFSLTGTATPGTDYTGVLRGVDRAVLGTFTPAASNTITIPDTAKGVLVELVPVIDNIFEGTETIGLRLESVSGSNPFYPIAIRSSDSSRLLDKDPGTVLVGFTSSLSLWGEADGGEESVHLLPVQLSQASAGTVTVDYRAAAGSALGFDSDWVFLDPEHGNTPVMSGTLTFAPGETVKNLPIRLRSDRIVESQEKFQVVLERPVGASLRSGLTQQTITVYDVIPTGLFREERWAGGTSYNNNSWNSETASYAGYLSGLTTAQQVGDDYSRRITGTMTVPTTGSYRFYVAGDDSARLYLSTTGSSSSKTQIASLNSWTSFQQWNKYSSQQSATFELQAGQTIYLEAQQREDSGGDHLSVGWTGPGFSTITPISTASPLVSVDNRYVRFLQESTTLDEGRTGEIVIGLDRVNLTAPVTVEVQLVAGGTAISGTDFLLGSQSVTFAPGEVAKGLSVAALADSLNEPVERVWVRLANAQGAQILSPSDLQLVVVDAPAPQLSTRPGFVERTAAAGTAVTQVVATVSAGRALQSWEILSGNPRVAGSATPAFDIDGEGRITVANPVALPLGSYQVQLTIRATDNAGSSSLAAVPVVVNGERILDEIWGGTEGYLTNDWDQPAKSHSYLTSFDSLRDVGDYYSRRITGVFTPPTTGDYSFWIAARDQGRLTIAPWEDPTNEREIATSPDAGYLAWDASDTQQSPPQSLVAGQRYILRAYQVDGNYSDHLSVAWSGPGIARQVIPGTAFLPTHPRLVLETPLPSETLPGTVTTASLSGTAITDTGIVPTITAGQFTRDPTLGLTGTAVAGGEVWLYDGLVFLGQTTATREGSWSLTTPVLEEGLHSFRVEVMDGWGNITRTADVVFEVRSKIVSNNPQVLSQAWGGTTAVATGQPIAQITGSVGPDQGTVVTQVLADAPFVEQRWAGSNVFNSGTWNSVTPTYTGTLSALTTAQNVGNDYSRRITGTITPVETGDYVFYLASDDSGRLYLSSNDSEASKSLIASVSGWTNFQEWNKYNSQRSSPIRLQAGQRYYIEAQHLEGSGCDHVSVAWTGPGITQITPISLVKNLVLADGTDGSVSLVTEGTTAVGVPAGVSTTYGGLSPDGTHVVFGSNHVTAFGSPGSPFTDTNGLQSGPYTDLFVFDKATGAVRLVTSGSNASTSRSRQAQFVGVSADNQYAIYTSDYVENIGTFTSPDKVVPTTWALVDGGYPTPTGKTKSTAVRVADLDPTTLFYSLNGSWIGTKNFPATVSTPTVSRSAGQLSFWVQGQDGVNGAAKAVKLEISDLPGGLLVKATAAKYLSTYQANYNWNNGGTSADVATSATSSGYGVSVLEARGAAVTEAMRVEGVPPSKDLIAFHIPTGTSRLLSHSPALGHDQSAVANVGNVTLAPDGQWVLFTAADASRLGNQGTSFTDTSPTTADLFAANLQTGEIRLLSHSSGSATASAGAAVSLLGLSADGTAAVFQSSDASLFGFTDSAPGVNDLFSVNLSSGTIQLVSRASASLPATSAGVAATFQKLLGSHVYFTAGNATAFGVSSDGNTSNADLFRYDLNTGTMQLLSHTATSVDAALNAGYQSGSVTASADGRFVVFSMDLPASYGGFTASITGTALFITDTTTGAIRLLNSSNATGTNLSYAAWGGVASNPRFFTPDGRSLIWQTGGYLGSMHSDLTGYGTGSDGQYTPAAMLFDLSQGVLPAGISQTNRLLSHAPAGVTVAGPSVTLLGVSRDNRLAYFSAPDASGFGNSGTAFVDSASSATDLFAVDLQTRRLELISGEAGMSYGQAATWQGLTDGGSVIFSVGNVAGITTAAGTLTDANGAGTDLLVKRFNLLYLATNDDTQTNGNRTDNLTARQAFVLNSLTTPGVGVQLLDNGTMVAEQTPGASGLLRWSLTNVSGGSHTYTLWSATEQIPVQILSPLGTSSLTLTVIVVDRPPTDLTLSAASVPENAAENTEMGTFAATDPNPGETFSYSLVDGTGGADNARFTISGNRLLAISPFDFETQHTYSFRVRVSDATNLTFEKVFTITVTDFNEVPVELALSVTGVAENQLSGTAVGAFSTSDPDVGNTFTYSLVTGSGDTDNSSFSIEGNSLKTAAAFDFEAQSSYSIRVRTTDQGGLSRDQVFTISVTNQNESPINLTLSAS